MVNRAKKPSVIFGSILGSMCLMRFSLLCFLMEEERLERNASSVVLTRSVQGHVVGDTGIVKPRPGSPRAQCHGGLTLDRSCVHKLPLTTTLPECTSLCIYGTGEAFISLK